MTRIILSLIFTSLFFQTQLLSQTQITIAEAREVDNEGAIVRDGMEVILEGKALAPNFRPEGLTFALIDIGSQLGISVFVLEGDLGYEVKDFDNLRITGVLGQFNGLEQINATSIEVLNPGGFNPATRIVTTLDQSTESYLISFKNATLVDPSQWESSGQFNVDITNGSEIIQMRIDRDIDISGMEAPTGTFDVTGIGGQFDNDAPFTEGYQIFPRSAADIDPYNIGGNNDYKTVTIPEIRENDNEGSALMIGELVETNGIVHGTNFRSEGLQFAIIDELNVGVSVFSFDENFGYTVRPGDLLTVRGEVAQFNGLTQISPDTIIIQSQDNPLLEPREVTSLSELTESSYITFAEFNVVDPMQWIGDGSSFNFEVEDQAGTRFLVRIDDNTYWANEAFPGGGNIYIGVGGQFDGQAPYDSGYQILPSFEEDIFPYLSTYDLYAGQVQVFPNPSSQSINVESEDKILSLEIYSLQGEKLKEVKANIIGLDTLASGNYILYIETDKGSIFKRISKI